MSWTMMLILLAAFVGQGAGFFFLGLWIGISETEERWSNVVKVMEINKIFTSGRKQ